MWCRVYLQGSRVQIFVIIFRRLRFVEPFGKVVRGKSQHRQRRISHALIRVEKYLLRRTTEKRKGKWKDDANTIENFENFGKKKIQETIIGTNEYVQRIFIRIENLFMRAIFRKIVHFFQKASPFGIFCFAANLVEER